MKKFDFLWPLGVIAIVFCITREGFVEFAKLHPYLSGFIKFGLLAPMGELLVIRMTKGNWRMPSGLIFRMLVWGILGIGIAFAFALFENGVNGVLDKNLILGQGNKFLTALYISAFMNLTFGPMMMGTHKITDKFIDLKYENKGKKVSIKEAVKAVDWYGFITFVVFKTVPFFWIPAHTIVFLLPGEYRLIVAALLSIALGILLTLANKKPKTAK